MNCHYDSGVINLAPTKWNFLCGLYIPLRALREKRGGVIGTGKSLPQRSFGFDESNPYKKQGGEGGNRAETVAKTPPLTNQIIAIY